MADLKTYPVRFLDPGSLPDNLELPPVGPIEVAPEDTVEQEFRTARTTWSETQKNLRAALPQKFREKRDEIQASNLDATEKAKTLKEIQGEIGAFAFGPGRNAYGGPLPSHPALQPIVADFWREWEEATRKLGKVAEKGLQDYETAGVTDPVKLRPLQAARLAGQNVEFLGIWGSPPIRSLGYSGKYDVWVVEVSAATGGWRVSGSREKEKGSQGFIQHADNITFKDDTLSFIAKSVDTLTKSYRRDASPMSLKLKDGKLHSSSKYGAKILSRTGEEAARASIDYWGVTSITTSAPPTKPKVKPPDLTDANYVWRRIAERSCSSFFIDQYGPYGSSDIYIPYRSKTPTLTPGAYGPFTDMLLGRSPGGGKNQATAERVFSQYDDYCDSPHPYLKRAASLFLAVSRARFQLAEADELFGNTPNSSIREFQQKVFLPGVRYVFQREADRAALDEQLRKEHPDRRIVVLDAPLSAESQESLKVFLGNAGGLLQDLKQRAMVSGLLAYADMAQVDRSVELWQQWMLPLARRCAGPESASPLVAVEGVWKMHTPMTDSRFHRLQHFHVRNVSGKKLSHAVIELVAENEWGEKAFHYLYLTLNAAEVVHVVVDPRWERRRLPFTNSMTVKWSVWAAQASEVDRQVKLTNPVPNPDPGGWRKDYLDFDRKFQAQGEALGAIVRNLPFLPVNQQRQRRRFLEYAAPGSSYAIRLADGEKTWAVRFQRLDADTGKMEIEVNDLVNRKPFQPETPVWKGDLKADPQSGFVVRLDSGWTLFLGHDDRLNFSIPQADGSPAKMIPLVRIKLS